MSRWGTFDGATRQPPQTQLPDLVVEQRELSATVRRLPEKQMEPEFLNINPAGKLPVLVDGNLVLTESVAIVL